MKESWILDYLRRSGDSKIYKGNWVENEYGFASWGLNEDGDLVIYHLYGNGNYWEQFFVNLAKALGCKKIIAATKRNPKAMARRFKMKITGYVLEREVDNGAHS